MKTFHFARTAAIVLLVSALPATNITFTSTVDEVNGKSPAHTPTPVRALTVSAAAGAKADS